METSNMRVKKRNGELEPVDFAKIERCLNWAAEGLDIDYREIYDPATAPLYDGIGTEKIQEVYASLGATNIRLHPHWSQFSARLVLQTLYKSINNGSIYYPHLNHYVKKMVKAKILNPKLLNFDFEVLNAAIDRNRDFNLSYMSICTLKDRYLIRNKDGEIEELPQHMFMRIAMGLALGKPKSKNGVSREDWAIRFYEALSNMDVVSSTPTLFNCGTVTSQNSSCYVLTMEDSLEGIFSATEEAAKCSKYAGGTAMDMTPLRGKGSFIGSTRGRAGGVVPYARLIDIAMYGFDQGGKRLGACALYLEVWHTDIFRFLEMADPATKEEFAVRNSFLASWIPDLFMKRLADNDNWTLFSPSDVPDLHDLYGEEFEKRYVKYEEDPRIPKQTVKAKKVWRAILKCLFNSKGNGWPCFKDEINRRSPTRTYPGYEGIVHSSNLCTEITLRNHRRINREDRTHDHVRTSVCNLASINLANHTNPDGSVNWKKLRQSVETGVNMIDCAIETGFVPNQPGRDFNREDRPLGLGIMGYTQMLLRAGIDYESQEHLEFADELMEFISYHAISESSRLGEELGNFPRYAESTWALGELPIDTAHPEGKALTTRAYSMDWEGLRKRTSKHMRNSLLMAIAPTATIANIADCTNCTELPYELIYTKSNLSGTFYVFSPLMADAMKDPSKRHLVKTAMGVDQIWTVRAAAVRQKWIDQSQSTNIFYGEPDGDKLSSFYIEGHRLGVKTFYYLRSKSPEIKAMTYEEAIAAAGGDNGEPAPKACSIDNPDCEACQ